MAAHALRAAGHERVGIIDVDAQHGNGTAPIFWERGDVLYGSAPERALPETGRCPRVPATGPGSTLSTSSPAGPWPRGARHWWCPWGLTLPLTDPESPLLVTRDRYRSTGHRLTVTGLPVVVQEGGYHLPTLGQLVAAYVAGHATRG